MGAVGVIAAGALLRWVPRYSPFATRGAGAQGLAVAKDPVGALSSELDDADHEPRRTREAGAGYS
jgi:hypothetical protein